MSNTDIVLAFIGAWNDRDWDAIEDAFTDDVVYHNIPMDAVQGKAAASAVIRSMQPQSVDWQVLNIAENGDVVLTERVDNFVMADGKQVAIPVMGTMELENGKIKAWRDYFDMAAFSSQMAN